MRNASTGPDPARTQPPTPQGIVCAGCGHFSVHTVPGLFTNPQTGSPRRFCSPACRQAAHRRRRAGVPEDTARQHHGGRGRHLPPTPPPGDPAPDDHHRQEPSS